ncbi:carbon storage regulator [Spongiibacter sp.]|uniref:carbon storage regulator n=1 Tax=Spongiibacter sp. TaxID=2024860 RepID=UPI00257D7609|nr:carbon storage regulator [Spongiibacter sp.]
MAEQPNAFIALPQFALTPKPHNLLILLVQVTLNWGRFRQLRRLDKNVVVLACPQENGVYAVVSNGGRFWCPADQGGSEMLTLTRRPGETIEIGDDIVIHINRIRGNQVSVSIDAPDDVDIWRGEIGVEEISPPLA